MPAKPHTMLKTLLSVLSLKRKLCILWQLMSSDRKHARSVDRCISTRTHTPLLHSCASSHAITLASRAQSSLRSTKLINNGWITQGIIKWDNWMPMDSPAVNILHEELPATALFIFFSFSVLALSNSSLLQILFKWKCLKTPHTLRNILRHI